MHNRPRPRNLYRIPAGRRPISHLNSFTNTSTMEIWQCEDAVEDIMSFIESTDEIVIQENHPMDCCHLDSTFSSLDSEDATKMPKTTRKRRNKPGYSTELLQRKKRELQSLRVSISFLEQWLECLLRLRTNAKPISSRGSHHQDNKIWAATAFAEFQRRCHAERTNHQLKELQDICTATGKAMLEILREKSAFKGFDFVLALPDTVHRLPTASELAETTLEVYRKCDSVFPKDDLPCFGCFVRPRGNMVEVVSRAPVDCTVKDASNWMWKALEVGLNHPGRKMHGRAPDTISSGFDIELYGPSGTRNGNGILVLQKIVEADRVVYAWASEVHVPVETIRAKAYIWIIISNTADPFYLSEIKFYGEFFMKPRNHILPPEQDVKYVRENILEPWSLQAREYSLFLMELVAEKAGTTKISPCGREV